MIRPPASVQHTTQRVSLSLSTHLVRVVYTINETSSFTRQTFSLVMRAVSAVLIRARLVWCECRVRDGDWALGGGKALHEAHEDRNRLREAQRIRATFLGVSCVSIFHWLELLSISSLSLSHY